jgi:hypothetical protein
MKTSLEIELIKLANLLFLLFSCSFSGICQMVTIIPETSHQLQFAKKEILPHIGNFTVNLIGEQSEVDQICKENNLALPKYMGKQRYAIRKKEQTIWVLADNTIGAMYGGLDVAEALSLGHPEWLVNKDQEPYLEERGIKFNLSLDLRTPSYNESGDAAQANIPEVWKEEFWQEYFDEMARNRMNVMSLWSLHLFPSMVYVPEFPEVGLNDVWRTKNKYDDKFSERGIDYDRPYLYENIEVVKKISIQEKMNFWRKVMQMADDRGISVYVFHWNLFTYGATGKHGITRSQTNDTTIAYFKAATREMIKQYPLLKGIGITAGEGMDNKLKDNYENERWLWRAYGEGINEGLKDNPSRDFKLIHRFHWASMSKITENFKDLNCRLDVSLKYAIAHMYSIPNPPFIKDAFPILSEKHKTWLTIRNDDIYSMRWANVDYARAFITSIPNRDLIAGYYMGPDGYTWGRDYLNKNTLSNPPLVIKKQWVSNRIWGKLSFDPYIPKSVFEAMVEKQFAGKQTKTLMPSWEAASMIFPYITRFVWGDIDLKWFPEANISSAKYRGFYTVEQYIHRQPMPGSNIAGITEWLHSEKKPKELISPLLIADTLQLLANKALAGLKKMPKYSSLSQDELQQTQSDIEAFATIGLYYSAKIKAAYTLAEFDKTNNEKYRKKSLEWLKKAETHWTKYAEIYSSKNLPALFNRVGYVDVNALKINVKKDYDIVTMWKPFSIKYKPQSTTEKVFRE